MPSADFAGTARYQVRSRLGQGGVGVVFEALDRQTGQLVALKTLKVPSPQAVLQLKHEFRAAQAVSHKNLVSLYELHREGEQWFFTMERVVGASLLEHVRPGGRLDVARLRACLAQLTDAVDSLHAAGLLHLDIKPENVRVGEDGRVVVLDFGMAGSREDALGDGEVAGTPSYMAPEQAASRALGPPADWYGVGALLYHALTGRPPFEGAVHDVLVRKQTEVPVAPSAIAPDVPVDLDRLCRALLAVDPRQRPTPHTIVRGAASTSLGRAALFVGRGDELAVLAGVLDERGDGPAVVVVTGPSGVGKSALARRFGETVAAERGAVILFAACHERETIAGGGADDLVDALARHLRAIEPERAAALVPRRAHLLADAYPVLRTVPAFARAPRGEAALVDPFTRRARVLDALRELLARLGERRPLVIVLDDLQWADAETLSVVSGLLAPPDAPPLVLIATWRPLEAGAALPAVFAGARRLPLSPLDGASAEELAGELLARADPSSPVDVHALARESGGLPLLLDALVSHALERRGAATPAITLHDAIAARLGALDPAARHVFDVTVTAGTPVDSELVARITGMPAVGVERALAVLRVQRLTRAVRRGERLVAEPYHDQIRAVGTALLDPDRRRELHAAIANALESMGNPDPELLVAHLRAAGDTERAATRAAEAAERAYRELAFHRAADLFEVALELGGEQRALRLARAEALSDAGLGAEAALDFLRCLDGASPSERLELQRQAAQQLLVTGHTAEGLATIREVLIDEGLSFPATPRRAVGWIAWRRLRLALRGVHFREHDARELAPRVLARIDVCWHVGLGLSIVDTMRGQAFHLLGIQLALRAGEPRRLGRALALDVAYRAIGGEPTRDAVEALYQRAHEMAARAGDPHALGLAIGCRGVAAFLRGDWADGARWCLEAETIFQEQCRGVPWELATAKLFAARSLLALGEVATLAARVETGIRECRDRGDLYGETSLRAAVLPFIHLLRDRRDDAVAEAEQALARWSPGSFQMQHYYQLVSCCSVHLYAGDAARGLARIEQAWPALHNAMLLRVQVVRVTLLELRARLHLAAAAGATGPHVDAAAKLARALDGERARWTAPLAAAIHASIAARAGDRAGARAQLEAAVAGFDAAAMALHAAAARRRLGALIGGDDGAALVDAADRWLDGRARDPAAITALLVPA